MINLKTKEEIETMREGGRILANVLEKLKKAALPGAKTIEIDKLAQDLILAAGCQISFKTVRNYQWTTCLCVNDTVVHGVPNEYQLKENDLLGIDVGLIKDGLHLDMAETILIRHCEEQSDEAISTQNVEIATLPAVARNDVENFLDVGKQTLAAAITQAKPGNRIGHISETIEKNITGAGYSVVDKLVGHGVGRILHEEPAIPGVLKGKIEETPEIVPGMTLAIEVIYNQGSPEIAYGADGWTIKSKDGSLSATFENSLAIAEDGPIILTVD